MYTQEHINKIGNTVIYLAERVTNPSKTKLLKLLYLLDEISIKNSGIPFLGLEYKVWKFGPVANDIYVEFTSKPSMLKDFIERKSADENDIIAPKKKFEDDEFSSNDITLLEMVARKFKDSTTDELINLTHRKNSPWYNAAVKNCVYDLLESEQISTTEIKVNMSELIEYDNRKKSLYSDYMESFGSLYPSKSHA